MSLRETEEWPTELVETEDEELRAAPSEAEWLRAERTELLNRCVASEGEARDWEARFWLASLLAVVAAGAALMFWLS